MSAAWPIRELGDMAAGPGAFVDGPFGSNLKKSEYVDEGVPIVRIQNIKPNYFEYKEIRHIDANKAQDLSRHGYRAGDIIIAKMGDPCGIACVVPPAASEGVIVADVVRFRGNTSQVDHKYLCYFLNSTQGRAEFARFTKGATRQRVNLSNMKEIRVPLPPISEQRRIAAILDKADAIRRKRRQALAETDTLLRSVFLALVGHRNPHYDTWPLASFESLAARGKNAMRTGPFGSDLLHSEFVDDGVAVLGIDNAVKNRFTWDERRFITEKKYQELMRYKVFPGDVIVTIMGTTGRSAVVPDDIPEAITTKHLATITPDRSKIHPTYLSFAIHSDPVVIRQIQRANKGAIMAGLNLGIIKQLEVHLPPLSQQERFARSVDRLYRQQETFTDPAMNGEVLFQSLCQRAFRGEL